MDKKYHYEDVKSPERDFQVKVMSNHESGASLHWHEYFELLYFISGKSDFVCDNERYVAKPGDFLIVNPNELHSISDEQENHHHICLQISPQFFSDVAFDNYIFKPHIEGDPQIKEYIEKILVTWERHEPAYDIEVKSLTYSLIAYLIKNHVANFLSDSAVQFRKNKPKTINEIIMHISKNYHTHMTTSSLADKFHLTEQHLCTIFKRATGKTPIDYINRRRVYTAATYLKTTNKRITDIALNVGFGDSHYFTQVFKKYMGVSPREYRKNDRQI